MGARIVVVGAGLIGASVARRLAEGGASVTVLEASRPAGGASLATFSWINALGKQPEAYFALNVAGLAEHRALVDELGGGEWYHAGGHLEWSADGDRLREKVERAGEAGLAASILTRQEAQALEPDVSIGDDDTVAFHPDEAWVDPVVLAARLLAHDAIALRVGEVASLEQSGGRVTAVALTTGESVPAEAVVIATGPRAGELAASAGIEIPMRHAPGLLAITEPAPARIGRVLHAPGIAIRPDGAGRLLIASDEIDKSIEPAGGDLPMAVALDQLLERARRAVPRLAGVGIEATRIGKRALTGDGLPAIGPLPSCSGAYIAVMHSGVTLAPIVGRLVAAELIDGVPDPRLEPFRPARFATTSDPETS